jgi:hypothetical protein
MLLLLNVMINDDELFPFGNILEPCPLISILILSFKHNGPIEQLKYNICFLGSII